MELDLDKMTRGEMKDACKAAGIKGVADKDKPTIRTALEVHMAKEQADAAAGKPPPPAPAVAGDPLTAEQRMKLTGASTEQISVLLADPELPTNWRTEFQAELTKRVRQAKTDAELARRTSKIVKYLITKGGPFVVDGRITQMRTGGVFSEFTHDLNAVRAQKIEFKLLEGRVVVGKNEMGQSTTTIVGEPTPREEPTGDAPTPGG